MRTRDLRFVHYVLLVVAVGIIAVELANAIPHTVVSLGHDYPGYDSTHTAPALTLTGAAVACAVALLILSAHAAGVLYRPPLWLFFLVCCVVASGLGIACIMIYHPRLVGDYRAYHDVAAWLSEYDVPHLLGNYRRIAASSEYAALLPGFRCWPEYPLHFYLTRTVVYLYPLYRVFGPSLLAVKLLNLVLHVLTAGALYLLCRRCFKNEHLSRLTVVLYLALPVNYIMLVLPNHDIAGRFYLSLLFLLAASIPASLNRLRSTQLAVLISTLIGMLMFLVELQRSVGIFLVPVHIAYVAILLTTRAHGKAAQQKPTRPRRCLVLLLVMILPLAVYFEATRRCSIDPLKRYRFLSELFGGNDAARGTDYRAFFEYRFSYMPKIPLGRRRTAYVIAKLGDEVYHNFKSYIRVLSEEATLLFAVGRGQRQVTAYQSPGSPLKLPVELTLDMSRVFRLLLFTGALAGCPFFLYRYHPARAFTVPLLFGAAYGSLLVLGFCAPRYSFLLHPQMAVLASTGIMGFTHLRAPWKRLSWPGRLQRRRLRRRILLPVLALVIAGSASLLAFRLVWPLSGLGFVDLRRPRVIASIGEREPARIAAPVRPQEAPHKFGMQMCEPPESSNGYRAEWTIDTGPTPRHQLSFFLRTSRAKADHYRVRVHANDKIVLDSAIASAQRAPLIWHPEFDLLFVSRIPIDTRTGTVKLIMEISRVGRNASQVGDFMAFLEFVRLKPYHSDR